MVARVTVWHSSLIRSRKICQAIAHGIARHEEVDLLPDSHYQGPRGEVAVFYGLSGNLPRIFADHKKAGRVAVYIDLGWWKRKWPTLHTGYHKIAINSRHPTAYFQNRKHPTDRIDQMGLALKPWREPRAGDVILLAGMGNKAAAVEGFEVEEWERAAIASLRHWTNREIIYRPKPSWKDAKPIPGTTYSGYLQPLTDILRRCHAVVTHHSNVAVDALVEGVPVFCAEGVAVPMGLRDLRHIESPIRPSGREQWLADIAYCQWNVQEMAQGAAWAHLLDEGLV